MDVISTADTAFQPGVTYATRSICDHDCIHAVKIERRTASSVWIERNGEIVRRGVYVYDGVERFKPFGNYSMAAVISADRRLA